MTTPEEINSLRKPVYDLIHGAPPVWGTLPSRLITPHRLYPELAPHYEYEEGRKPTDEALDGIAEHIAALPSGSPVVIDEEDMRFNLLREGVSIDDLKRTAGVYRFIYDWLHSQVPNVMYGFYTRFPSHDYWPGVDPETYDSHKRWRGANLILWTYLKGAVDAHYPSFYAPYALFSHKWHFHTYARYCHAAIDLICELDRSDRPIIPFHRPGMFTSTKTAPSMVEVFTMLNVSDANPKVDGIVLWDAASAGSDIDRVVQVCNKWMSIRSGADIGDADPYSFADVNRDGEVDLRDLSAFNEEFGRMMADGGDDLEEEVTDG